MRSTSRPPPPPPQTVKDGAGKRPWGPQKVLSGCCFGLWTPLALLRARGGWQVPVMYIGPFVPTEARTPGLPVACGAPRADRGPLTRNGAPPSEGRVHAAAPAVRRGLRFAAARATRTYGAADGVDSAGARASRSRCAAAADAPAAQLAVPRLDKLATPRQRGAAPRGLSRYGGGGSSKAAALRRSWAALRRVLGVEFRVVV